MMARAVSNIEEAILMRRSGDERAQRCHLKADIEADLYSAICTH
jgi:hypothetical protein